MHVRCTAKEFVRKGDLWNIAITKIPLFSPFERRLLTAYLPHQYRKRKFDVENPRALAELNQLCFNFAITIDYTAAKIQVQPGASSNVVPGFVAEKLNVLNPALRELNLGVT